MEALHEETPFDLAFHPSSLLVATSLITGELYLFRYSEDSPPERLFAVKAQVKAHDESCRAFCFADSGHVILMGSADCSVLASDVETGKPIAHLENAHENGINRFVTLAETTIASGDDEACIKVWDTRGRSCFSSFHCHEDYISDTIFVPETNQILATSGDGTLSVNNLCRNKVKSQSEFSEDELLSVVVMKNGQKVVCGTQIGALLLYSLGYFKDCRWCCPELLTNIGFSWLVSSDRFLGHTLSVDTMLKLDEEALISASDGFANDEKCLGSISHDKMLKTYAAAGLARTLE